MYIVLSPGVNLVTLFAKSDVVPINGVLDLRCHSISNKIRRNNKMTNETLNDSYCIKDLRGKPKKDQYFLKRHCACKRCLGFEV